MKHSITNAISDKIQLVGESDQLRIVQETNFIILTNCKCTKPEAVLEIETQEIIWGFEIQTDHQSVSLAQRNFYP